MPGHEANTAYFPPLCGTVDCFQCEIASECWCRCKYQRKRGDFSHTSGRCPRLPDYRGFVEQEHRKLYAKTFSLVHAERGEDVLYLTLTVPGMKRPKKVYQTQSGEWYFHEKNDDGTYSKREISFESYHSREQILDHMDMAHTDYCLFRAEIFGYCI